MALLFMESFDGYGGTAAHMTLWSTQPTLQTSSPTPRTGTHCMRGFGSARRTFTAGSATLIAGYALYFAGNNGNCIFYDGSNAQVCIVTRSDGAVEVRRGNNVGTLIATSAVCLVVSSWNFIEFKAFIDNSGTYAVKVNGVSVLSGSADTQAEATAAVNQIQLLADASSASAIDDVYLLDSTGSSNNDFIGDCKVECLHASTGNGTNTGLTPSTGSDHGALVDETPANDDTDYNGSATAGVKDTYNFPSVATTGVIKGVQVCARVKKTDSAAKTMALVAREGSTDYDGTTVAVASTTYSQYMQLWQNRPSDSTPWTISDVNAAEFGVKVVS